MNTTENREQKEEERVEILKKYSAHYRILEEEFEDLVEFFFFFSRADVSKILYILHKIREKEVLLHR